MHEVQHRGQAAEGFASGTNPGYWNRGENYDRAAEKYRDNRARLLNGLSTEDLALYDEYRSAEREMGAMLDGSMLYDESRMDALEKRSDELYKELYGKEWFGKLNRYDRILGDAGEAVNELYRNTAGEIEARDTAARRRMSAEERKKRRLCWATRILCLRMEIQWPPMRKRTGIFGGTTSNTLTMRHGTRRKRRCTIAWSTKGKYLI